MTTFSWEEHYRCGIDPLDEQHRKIIDYMAKIYDDLSNSKTQCDLFNSMLNNLELLCQMHFIDEEKFMDDCNYPRTSEHKRHHELFLASLDRFKVNNKCHTENVLVDFNAIREKFVNHILNEGMNLGSFKTNMA